MDILKANTTRPFYFDSTEDLQSSTASLRETVKHTHRHVMYVVDIDHLTDGRVLALLDSAEKKFSGWYFINAARAAVVGQA